VNASVRHAAVDGEELEPGFGIVPDQWGDIREDRPEYTTPDDAVTLADGGGDRPLAPGVFRHPA
jgi:hypothetical protein